MKCDPFVVESFSELLMLKANVICVGKGLKSNLEHPTASAAVEVEDGRSDSVRSCCHVLAYALLNRLSAKEP